MRNRGVKTYSELPPYDEREILRYAGVRGEADDRLKKVLSECLKECAPVISARVGYRVLSREELFSLTGEKAETWLKDSERAVVFAATVGLGLDRLIARYAERSPAKALFFQAIGAERIERVCDLFCQETERALQKEGYHLGGRFSPGYGNFPLTAQRALLFLLEGEKLGIGLTEGLMMTPTKSITAIAGVFTAPTDCEKNCNTCNKVDCQYRI